MRASSAHPVNVNDPINQAPIGAEHRPMGTTDPELNESGPDDDRHVNTQAVEGSIISDDAVEFFVRTWTREWDIEESGSRDGR